MKVKHPAFNKQGLLVQDGRWLKKKGLGGNFNSTLRKAIGYALPYPDLTGDGSSLIDELWAAEKGMDYGVYDAYSDEYIENTEMAFRFYRCHLNSFNGIVEVHASGVGNFHTGTLMALIKEKWPTAKWAVIKNDRGPVAKKTGKMQVTVACLDLTVDLPALTEKFVKKDKEKTVVASQSLVHMTREAYEDLILK